MGSVEQFERPNERARTSNEQRYLGSYSSSHSQTVVEVTCVLCQLPVPPPPILTNPGTARQTAVENGDADASNCRASGQRLEAIEASPCRRLGLHVETVQYG